MAATTFVPIETYLSARDYEPDCEYVDGVIEERPMPEYDHASWQGAILAFFREHRLEWSVRALPELRVRVGTTRFRIPDVTVLDRDAPVEQIVVTPPLAVVEILSPEDRMAAMLVKLSDYERMGIGGIWVIEPTDGVGYGYKAGVLERASVLGLPSLGVTFTLDEIAAFLD
jgi:Uma2 family endonuclease